MKGNYNNKKMKKTEKNIIIKIIEKWRNNLLDMLCWEGIAYEIQLF